MFKNADGDNSGVVSKKNLECLKKLGLKEKMDVMIKNFEIVDKDKSGYLDL